MTNEGQNKIPPIWVANLSRSANRRQFMEEQFARLQVGYELFLATDGRKLTRRDFLQYSLIRALVAEGRFLSANEIGCAITHANMYRRIVAEGHDEVLILEDDVIVSEDLLELLRMRDKFPSDWELMNFYSNSTKTTIGLPPLLGKYALCQFVGNANMAAAYLLSQAGARKLLRHLFPLRYPADGITGRTSITGIVSYGFEPQPVAVRAVPSDIWEGKQPAWKRPFWVFTMKWVRKIKRFSSIVKLQG